MRKYYKYFVNKTVTRNYYKNAFETESKLINPDGLITSASGGGGWTIYSQSDSYNNVYLMLNATANTSYPRWQAGSPNVYAYLKTPKKCVLTSYLTTQMYDISAYGYHYTERVCNCWRICGYQSESDLLSLTNGYLIDENTWSSVSRGSYKTVDLNNRKGFQYYTIQMVSNFGGGSYCSMGNTKFYVREILDGIDESEITDDHIDGTPSDYDFYKDVDVYESAVKTVRKYYKYVEQEWTQPILTSLGTADVDSMALENVNSPSSPLNLFDGNTGSLYQINNDDGGYKHFIIIFKNQVKLTSADFLSYSSAYVSGGPGLIYIYGSLDKETWTEVMSYTAGQKQDNAHYLLSAETPDFYKYYKISMRHGSVTSRYWGNLREGYLYGTERVLQETDISDYDFYKDIPKFYNKVK